VFFSDPSDRACPLVRSFEVSFFFDWCIVLSLFVCLPYVCLCPMIDAIRVNVVRGSRALEEYEDEVF
jgi:hypothetical protein